MDRIDKLALHYRCEYCLAGEGVWCRTNRGANATALHDNRTDPLRLAFSDGYLEGERQHEIKVMERRTTADDIIRGQLQKHDPTQVLINEAAP